MHLIKALSFTDRSTTSTYHMISTWWSCSAVYTTEGEKRRKGGRGLELWRLHFGKDKTLLHRIARLTNSLTCSKVCWARSVVDIITPAAKEPNSRLSPSLSLHWNHTKLLDNCWMLTVNSLSKKCKVMTHKAFWMVTIHQIKNCSVAPKSSQRETTWL